MEYKDNYEFIYEFFETNDGWKEGGEYYDENDNLIREVILYEDEANGDPIFVDENGLDRYPYTIEIDGVAYPDLWFGPASGMMWARNTRAVQVIIPCPPVNGRDKMARSIGWIDYETDGSDSAKVYWDLAELVLNNYKRTVEDEMRKIREN